MLESAKATDAIRAVGLSKIFGGRQVLQQVDLQVAVGEAIAITGANGAGKTTLLRCLAGVARLDAGEVWRHGETSARGPRVSGSLGMVLHESQLYPNLTLYENLQFAARMYAIESPPRQASAWLARVGLTSYAKCLPGQISHGMRRRMSIARGIIHNPRIILLDEPFSGLDREGGNWLASLLADLRRTNRSLCFTTHDTTQAKSCADRVLCLQSGKLHEALIGQKSSIRQACSPRQAA